MFQVYFDRGYFFLDKIGFNLLLIIAFITATIVRHHMVVYVLSCVSVFLMIILLGTILAKKDQCSSTELTNSLYSIFFKGKCKHITDPLFNFIALVSFLVAIRLSHKVVNTRDINIQTIMISVYILLFGFVIRHMRLNKYEYVAIVAIGISLGVALLDKIVSMVFIHTAFIPKESFSIYIDRLEMIGKVCNLFTVTRTKKNPKLGYQLEVMWSNLYLIASFATMTHFIISISDTTEG